jgi:23S rRNA (guanosine2251-2'-O)-methyltransferase
MSREKRDARAREVENLCQGLDIPLNKVADDELSGLADGVHNGFVVEIAASEAPDSVSGEIVVLVEDVQDPRNLGALVRVCDGAGVGRLLVRDRGSAQVTAAAVKASAGAAEWLPIERITNSFNEIKRLQGEGYWVYGAAEEGAAPWDLDLSGNVLLCIGGEEKGLRRRTRESCDALIGLPMLGRVSSLNLSTAAAAILYEIVRQRQAASPTDA